MTRLAGLALALLLAGCARSGPSELLETAKLEDVQRNLPHARKLYGNIVKKYPASEEAKEAQKRLAELGPGPAGE